MILKVEGYNAWICKAKDYNIFAQTHNFPYFIGAYSMPLFETTLRVFPHSEPDDVMLLYEFMWCNIKVDYDFVKAANETWDRFYRNVQSKG